MVVNFDRTKGAATPLPDELETDTGAFRLQYGIDIVYVTKEIPS